MTDTPVVVVVSPPGPEDPSWPLTPAEVLLPAPRGFEAPPSRPFTAALTFSTITFCATTAQAGVRVVRVCLEQPGCVDSRELLLEGAFHSGDKPAQTPTVVAAHAVRSGIQAPRRHPPTPASARL